MNIGGISYFNINPAAVYMNTPIARPAQPGSSSGQTPALNPGVVPGINTSIPPILSPAAASGGLFFSIDGDRAEISYGLLEELKAQGVCSTCENRRYVDQSNDSSVSFQTPTKISPNMAAAAVASHEQEHVRNEQANALRDGREIVNQSVTLTYDTCPECGKQYVSGGTTRTTSISKSDSEDAFEPHTIETGAFGGEDSDEGE